MSADRDAMKHAAADYAVAQVADGMVLGLGSGSTAELAIAALADRVASGLKITGIATSQRSAALARRLHIPLTDFAQHRRIDLTIDGADQVERGSLNLIKGLGGALLREKIVASASTRMIVVIDETKLVERLGGLTPLPVEIAAFGWQATMDRLAELGAAPRLRQAGDEIFVTDGGNYIADCLIATIDDAPALQTRLAGIVGVIESGLFIGLARQIAVGRAGGVELIE